MAKTINMNGDVKQSEESPKKYEAGTYKLLEEEVNAVKQLNSAYQNAKMQLGELELKKAEIIKHIDSIAFAFREKEKAMVEKYGATAEMNLANGTITVK